MNNRKVVVEAGDVNKAPHALVAEDKYNQHRPADEGAERNGKGGDLRQDSVADRVAVQRVQGVHAFGLRQGHVVFTLHRDHHAAHSQRPVAKAHDHDGHGGQDAMMNDAASEVQATGGLHSHIVSADLGEPVQYISKNVDQKDGSENGGQGGKNHPHGDEHFQKLW